MLMLIAVDRTACTAHTVWIAILQEAEPFVKPHTSHELRHTSCAARIVPRANRYNTDR